MRHLIDQVLRDSLAGVVDLRTTRGGGSNDPPMLGPSRASGLGCYLIQVGDGGPIKIGKSNDLASRLAALQTANPWELHVIGWHPRKGYRFEGRLHVELAAHRIRGEWFHPHPDVLAHANL